MIAAVDRIVGTENRKRLALGNPLRILRGKPVEELSKSEMPPQPAKRKRWGFW